MINFKEAQVD